MSFSLQGPVLNKLGKTIHKQQVSTRLHSNSLGAKIYIEVKSLSELCAFCLKRGIEGVGVFLSAD